MLSLFSLLVLASLQARGYTQGVLTVCPDDYLPHNGCVTPDDLNNNNNVKSDTTYRFVPAFKMLPNQVIRFENVGNIILDSAGPDKANVSCLGENSGFFFANVHGVTIRNLQFNDCAMNNIPFTNPVVNCTLFIMLSTDIQLDNVAFERGKPNAYSVFATSVYSHLTISNTTFRHLQGPALSVQNEYECENFYQNCSKPWQATIDIVDSVFDSADYMCNMKSTEVIQCASFAISLISSGLLNQSANIRISNVSVTNNTHRGDTRGITIVSASVDASNIVLEKICYKNNHALDTEFSGGTTDCSEILIHINYAHNSYHATVSISDSMFLSNTGPAHDDSYNLIQFKGRNLDDSFTISLRNVTIWNNFGHSSVISPLFHCEIFNKFSFEMIDSNISGNIFNATLYGKTGLLHFKCIHSLIQNCTFENNINSETALLLEDSHLNFVGINTIQGNTGYNGGGMAIYGDSYLAVTNDSTLFIEDNRAKNLGGGMYVEVKDQADCWFNVGVPSEWGCIEFNNNSATTAGNDIYGGSLQKCTYTDHVRYGWEAMTHVVHTPNDYIIDVTSDPLHMCDCSTESVTGCINVVPVIHHIKAYPGETFSLQLVVVGQLLNTTTFSGVPSAVYAGILPLHSNNTATIPQGMKVQNTIRTCSKVDFAVSSTNHNEVMVLTVKDNLDLLPDYFLQLWNSKNQVEWGYQIILKDLTVPAFVTIELTPCPIGFELSEQAGKCQCVPALLEYVTDCDINTKLLTKKPLAWISGSQGLEYLLHLDDSPSLLYLTHSHCPFDFCYSSDEFEFDMDEPNSQCRHNRSGILCGQCNNSSLTLGSMECMQCTNIYLLLLIPFAFAGILLILFLSLTDMTVAAGTINGLLFYANIVWENKATFFPPETSRGFLAVFVAWLNLDLGISTCFYDGLDSYVYTWLQFGFPIFIWFLAFAIIAASRYFSFINKLCGRNIVQVLATLFLLSYTKLQRTIVTGLTFTAINVSNGGKFYVWLLDGNVLYLQGKHIALFLVSILFLLTLFVPYTLSIALGPWLQTKTQYRVFCWVLKLKPFFDAYFGPLKDKHRYWTGLLLLSRMALSLINIIDHPHVNLLSIIVFTFSLLVVLLWMEAGGVYKMRFLSLLDGFFLINLGLLASAMFYSEVSDGNKNVNVSISTGATFAVFCLIVLCHVIKKIRLLYGNKIFEQTLLERGGHAGSNNSEDSDDALLEFIDEEREMVDVTTATINLDT